jgi:tetratricopeptide (TPR) repeat protein
METGGAPAPGPNRRAARHCQPGFTPARHAALEEAASQIIALQPASPDGYALRSASFLQRKQFAAAEQDAQKAIEAAPNRAAGYIAVGNHRAARSQYPDAEKAFQQALDRDPQSSDALAGLMRAYLSQQQVDKAIAAAKLQIGKAPNSSAFYDLLGSALLDPKKDFSGAEAAFKKSVELDKRNSGTW